jgi:hypothetical protein
MELTTNQVASQIESIIDAIKLEGKQSVELIKAEAETMRDYDKQLAISSAGHKVAGMAITMIRDQAKGDASDCLYKMIVAQKSLKSHWERLKYLQAQLNGYQSIYRHLEVT